MARKSTAWRVVRLRWQLDLSPDPLAERYNSALPPLPLQASVSQQNCTGHTPEPKAQTFKNVTLAKPDHVTLKLMDEQIWPAWRRTVDAIKFCRGALKRRFSESGPPKLMYNVKVAVIDFCIYKR